MSRDLPRALLVAAALLVVAILATWPVITDPAHLCLAGPGNNDYWFNTYVVFWGAHALTSAPLQLHDTNMFWPERYTFAYSDMELSHSLLVLPVILATYNPVLTINVLLLLSMVIGGTGAWALGHHVTGSDTAGVLAAALFVLNDAHFTRYLAIQFFGDHWLPWFVLALLVWLETWRWPWALAAAVLYVLHALTGSHAAVFGALVGGTLILVHLVRARPWRRELLTGLAILTLIPLLVLGPIFYPYLLLQDRMAAERGDSAEILRNGSARPRDLLSGASRFHAWVDETVGWPSAAFGGRLRAHLFPGWIPLLLALALLLPVRRGERQKPSPRPGDAVAWATLAAICLLLALGPPAGVYRLLAALPGIRLIRVPSRFVLPGLLGLTLLATYGFARVSAARRSRRARIGLLVVILVLFAGESWFAPLSTARLDPGPDPVSTWLARQPGDFAVLEIPVAPDNLTAHARQMRQSMYHWKHLLVGYSGWRPPEVRRRLLRIQRRFPAPGILDELAQLGVRYVVVLENRVPAALLDQMRDSRRLRIAEDLGGISIWELTP